MSDSAPLTSPATRRAFIHRGAAAAVTLPAVVSTLAACGETKAAAPRPPSPREKADQMDAMHEKGVKAFPAKTEGQGNQVLHPRIKNGVKVYDLTAEEIQWEVEPGRKVKAWTYNRQVPGPQIRVGEGDRVRINLTNKLPESTAIHFHGLELPNDQDGVPFITQPPVKPGESYTYEFTVPNAGSHMYHSHHNAAIQVGLGLLGAFVVEPKRPLRAHKADVDCVMVLNDGYHGYTLNGKGFPRRDLHGHDGGCQLRSCGAHLAADPEVPAGASGDRALGPGRIPVHRGYDRKGGVFLDPRDREHQRRVRGTGS